MVYLYKSMLISNESTIWHLRNPAWFGQAQETEAKFG